MHACLGTLYAGSTHLLSLLARSCPSSGADDAGDAGIWRPCIASTVPPNKDESHHSKATSRGASRTKKQFGVRLPARLVPVSTAPCPTYAQQRLHARLLQCEQVVSLVAQLVSLSPTPEPLAAHPGNWQRKGLGAKESLVARPGCCHNGLENSLFPAPPIQTTPPADREAGLAAGQPSHRPPYPDGHGRIQCVRGQTDGRPLLSHRSDLQHVHELLIDPGPHGRKPEPGTHTSFCGSDCTRARR